MAKNKNYILTFSSSPNSKGSVDAKTEYEIFEKFPVLKKYHIEPVRLIHPKKNTIIGDFLILVTNNLDKFQKNIGTDIILHGDKYNISMPVLEIWDSYSSTKKTIKRKDIDYSELGKKYYNIVNEALIEAIRITTEETTKEMRGGK